MKPFFPCFGAPCPILFRSLLAAALMGIALISVTPQMAPAQTSVELAAKSVMFSETERASSIEYWNAPGRYETGPRPDAKNSGVFVVRLTPEASVWFNAFNRNLRPEKLAPTKNTVEITAKSRPWDAWVVAKVKYDRAVAQQQANAANAELFGALTSLPAPNNAFDATTNPANSTLPPATAPLPATASPLATAPPTATAPNVLPLVELPPHPGPMPLDLLAAIGNAPPFAACVAPQRHTVRFASGESFVYTDHISPSNPRNPYFRFAQGVASGGTALSRLAPGELEQIFAASGLTSTETRVMRAISLLEGGFDSINTYDTGFLSVGFIQFAALEGGNGSLGSLLQYEKATNPADFKRDFRDFGIDIDNKGALVVVDPASGAELNGGPAVQKIIDDKRLTAVFHLAGRRSLAFRAAQIHVAKTNYYPADSPIEVEVGGKILTGLVRDVVKSEAGLATLFDRKVNIGNVKLINPVLQQLMIKHGLTQLEDVSPYEREIITALRWRSDFLKDVTLTQPA